MRFRLSLLVVTMLTLVAPEAASAQSSSQWVQRNPCSSERHRAPRRRPAVAQRDSLREHVADTMREQVVRAAREAGVAPEGLVLVEYDQRARTGRIWSAQGSVPRSVLGPVYTASEPLLAAYPQPPRGRVLLHLRLDPLPRDSVRVGDVVMECRPDVRNVNDIWRMIEDFSRRASMGWRPARVLALVARDGEVVHVEISQSSGTPRVDEFALELVEAMRFTPATVNGVPLDVWVEQPVEVRPPPREP